MGIPAIMYCFFFLRFIVAGAEAWSIDAADPGGDRRHDCRRHTYFSS
jgi:hypothetical protein